MLSVFDTQVKEAARQYEEDTNQPPLRIPPLTRNKIIQNLSQLRIRNIKIDGGQSNQSALIGLPREYSSKPLCQLQRVSLSAEMYVRKTHKGRYLLCRIITPPTCMASVFVGVEDPEGEVAQLGLYNYPGMTDITHDILDKLLPIGTLLAIREPTYTYSISGNTPMVRVDAPSDVVFLSSDSSYLQNMSWSSDFKSPLEKMKTCSIDEWLSMGRNEVKSQHWLTAAVFFLEGLRLDLTHPTLRLNRALCYLHLGWYNAAFADTEKVRNSDGDQTSALQLKATFRSAKAQYMLENYTQAISYVKSYADNKECKDLIRKAKQRLIEQRTGEYDWILLFKESQGIISQIDIANYIGPIEVTAIANAGGGRGVCVTWDVEIGELLLVEKSLASCFDHDFRKCDVSFDGHVLFTGTPVRRTQACLVHKVVERLWDDVKLDQTLKSMYAGPSLDSPRAWQTTNSFLQSRALNHPLEPTVDIDITRIEAVCTFNAFGTSPITEKCLRPHLADATKVNNSPPRKGTLLFGLASMINHSCQGNASWYTLGDAIFIRSTCALKKGEEVTHSYYPMNSLYPFARRSKTLLKWGIDCKCLLCTADRADGDAACAKKIVNEDETSQIAEMNVDSGILLMKSKIKDIEKSYSKSSSLSSVFILKRSLLYAHSDLSLLHHRKASAGQYRSHVFFGIRQKIKVLESGGLVIFDKSLYGPVAGPSALQQGYMPIDAKKSQCFEHVKLTLNAIHIAWLFIARLEDAVRGKGWMNAALWINRIHIGGDKDLFKKVYEYDIYQTELSGFI